MEKAKRDCFESTITWTDGGNIGIVLFADKLITGYSAGSGAEWEKVRDTFYFEGVPNNYGGADRIYFTCPYCGQRVQLLYLHRRHFKCRKCAGLNYRSQQTTKGWDTAVYRLDKFLKVNFNITDLAPCDTELVTPPRPKGMHEKTYHRLLVELKELQINQMNAFIASLGRLGIFR